MGEREREEGLIEIGMRQRSSWECGGRIMIDLTGDSIQTMIQRVVLSVCSTRRLFVEIGEFRDDVGVCRAAAVALASDGLRQTLLSGALHGVVAAAASAAARTAAEAQLLSRSRCAHARVGVESSSRLIDEHNR